MKSGSITYITGTNTGAGKTVLTGLMLYHLRRVGVPALAMKPFCSGDRGDAKALNALQNNELALEVINPFSFRDPVSPLVAARNEGKEVKFEAVLAAITRVKPLCENLLVEGAGGLLSPLGEGFTLVDIIKELPGNVVVAARNELGVINHALLTVALLQSVGVENVKVVLMGTQKKDASAKKNASILREWITPTPVFEISFLQKSPVKAGVFKKYYRIVKKPLALTTNSDNLSPRSTERAVKSKSVSSRKKVKKTFDD